MATAQVVLKMNPTEFDTLRKALVSYRNEMEIEAKNQQNSARVRNECRAQCVLANDLHRRIQSS